MESNNDSYHKVGKNIRSLRKAYGQSLLDLALDIGVGVSAISQYENGKRTPERDILINMAKHFKITENELLYGDYSRMKDLTSAPVNSKEHNLAMIKKMLPIFFDEEATKNGDFARAYELHLKLYNDIIQGTAWDDTQFDTCMKLYKQASRAGIHEATANSLWWEMFFGAIYSLFSPRFVASIEALHGKEATMKDVINGYLYSPDDEDDDTYIEYQTAKNEFVKENEVDILVNIALLKNTNQYVALGDYYLALCYIFGLRNNDMSPEMNSAIGYEMMHILGVLGNPYAKAFSSPAFENNT